MCVLCKNGEALVIDQHQQFLAVGKLKGGFYVANMKVRNPRFSYCLAGLRDKQHLVRLQNHQQHQRHAKLVQDDLSGSQ